MTQKSFLTIESSTQTRIRTFLSHHSILSNKIPFFSHFKHPTQSPNFQHPTLHLIHRHKEWCGLPRLSHPPLHQLLQVRNSAESIPELARVPVPGIRAMPRKLHIFDSRKRRENTRKDRIWFRSWRNCESEIAIFVFHHLKKVV